MTDNYVCRVVVMNVSNLKQTVQGVPTEETSPTQMQPQLEGRGSSATGSCSDSGLNPDSQIEAEVNDTPPTAFDDSDDEFCHADGVRERVCLAMAYVCIIKFGYPSP